MTTTATKTIRSATLRITHDGISKRADVLVNVGEPSLKSMTLDQAIEAAMQSDETLAAAYRDILRQVSGELQVAIVREMDGIDSANGACWLAVELRHGPSGNGDAVSSKFRVTSNDFRGWTIPDAQHSAERKLICDRLAKMGLSLPR